MLSRDSPRKRSSILFCSSRGLPATAIIFASHCILGVSVYNLTFHSLRIGLFAAWKYIWHERANKEKWDGSTNFVISLIPKWRRGIWSMDEIQFINCSRIIIFSFQATRWMSCIKITSCPTLRVQQSKEEDPRETILRSIAINSIPRLLLTSIFPPFLPSPSQKQVSRFSQRGRFFLFLLLLSLSISSHIVNISIEPAVADARLISTL